MQFFPKDTTFDWFHFEVTDFLFRSSVDKDVIKARMAAADEEHAQAVELHTRFVNEYRARLRTYIKDIADFSARRGLEASSPMQIKAFGPLFLFAASQSQLIASS